MAEKVVPRSIQPLRCLGFKEWPNSSAVALNKFRARSVVKMSWPRIKIHGHPASGLEDRKLASRRVLHFFAFADDAETEIVAGIMGTFDPRVVVRRLLKRDFQLPPR